MRQILQDQLIKKFLNDIRNPSKNMLSDIILSQFYPLSTLAIYFPIDVTFNLYVHLLSTTCELHIQFISLS